MKKIISFVLCVMLVLPVFVVTTAAVDINTIPQVGKMEVKPVSKSTMIALRTDGTIEVYGVEYVRETAAFLAQVSAVTNAVGVACTTDNLFFVLKNTGKVEMLKVYEDVDTFSYDSTASWENIVAIEGGYNHVVGLKADGTVVAAGPNRYGERDVEGFKNIKSIYANNHVTLCIDTEGKVFSAGQNPYAKTMSDWTNIKDVSIGFHFIGTSYAVAVTNDGDIIELGTYYGDRIIENNTLKYRVIEDQVLIEEVPLAKVVDVQVCDQAGFFAITEDGDCYKVSASTLYVEPFMVGNVHSLGSVSGQAVTHANQYFILDNNGKIHSSVAAFDSDKWILTTNITYNGNKVETDVAPYVKDGRTLAPIRAILEALGMQVTWDPATQTATAVKDGTVITVTINSNIATVNGEQKTLDVPAQITNDRTFVPVRFFGEALNMTVDWDKDTKTVIITQ